MLFQKRIERAFRHQSEAKQDRDEPEEVKPADLMEKGDLAAMMIAALITILPAAVLALLVLAAAGWLFLRP